MDVFVGWNAGTFWVIDGATGTELWHFDSENWIDSSPTVVDLDHDGYLEVGFGTFRYVVHITLVYYFEMFG